MFNLYPVLSSVSQSPEPHSTESVWNGKNSCLCLSNAQQSECLGIVPTGKEGLWWNPCDCNASNVSAVPGLSANTRITAGK